MHQRSYQRLSVTMECEKKSSRSAQYERLLFSILN